MPQFASMVVTRIRDKLLESMGERVRTGNLAMGMVCYGGRSNVTFTELLHVAESQAGIARGDTGVGTADTVVP
jgi:hypothetical protein